MSYAEICKYHALKFCFYGNKTQSIPAKIGCYPGMAKDDEFESIVTLSECASHDYPCRRPNLSSFYLGLVGMDQQVFLANYYRTGIRYR